MFDTDEVVMPQMHKDWHTMLEDIERDDNASRDFDALSFRHVYFFGNTSLDGQQLQTLEALRPHLRGFPLKIEQDMRAREVFSEGMSLAFFCFPLKPECICFWIVLFIIVRHVAMPNSVNIFMNAINLCNYVSHIS